MNARRYVCMAAMGAMIGASDATLADNVADRLNALEKRVAELDTQAKRTGLNGVHIGAYGEMHYNNLSGKGGAADREEVDFHRFVIFLGHEFTDRIRFNSEIELEHALAGEGKPGEVEVEQAYLDFDLNDRHTARAGLFLVPVGLLNKTHEPPRFFGVERPAVESAILPTTWWEAGAGLYGELGAGFTYAAYVHSGLGTSTGSTYAVRSGRKKVASAPASDPAATVALYWAAPGVTLGGAAHYQSDITQGADPRAGSAWMGEIHADLRRGPLGLRTLYAEWSLDGDGPRALGADRQYGWYVEPSYRPCPCTGIFARYGEWDNQAGASAAASGKRQWDVGLNVWPHEQVVLKADYQWQDNESGKEQDGFNLGIGYEF
jgi:hypothetical protein